MITPSDSCAIKDEGRSSDASVDDCDVNGVMVWGQDRFGRHSRTLCTSHTVDGSPDSGRSALHWR